MPVMGAFYINKLVAGVELFRFSSLQIFLTAIMQSFLRVSSLKNCVSFIINVPFVKILLHSEKMKSISAADPLKRQIIPISTETASALAVYGFPGTVSALFLSVFSGICQATQPVVAESFGAGRYERCNEVGKTGMITAGCILFLQYVIITLRKNKDMKYD